MKPNKQLFIKTLSILLLISIITIPIQHLAIQPSYGAVSQSCTIKVAVKTADVGDAGTDGDVYITFVDHDGMRSVNEIDTPGYDDFERGDYKTYNATFKNAPWMLKKVILEFDDSDGWRVEYINLTIPTVDGGVYTSTYKLDVNEWMGSDSGNCLSITWTLGGFYRWIYSDTVSSMNRTIYFSEDEAKTYFGYKTSSNPNWGVYFEQGKEVSDYNFGTYNPNDYKYADPPGDVVLTVDSNYKKGTGDVSNCDYTFEQNSEYTTFQPYSRIWTTMKNLGKDFMSFNFKWTFPARTTWNGTRSSTITLKRKVFHMSQSSILIPDGTAEKISTDNYYFNNNKQSIQINSKIYNNIGVSNTNLADNFNGNAYLLKGNYDSYSKDANNNIIYEPKDKICDLNILKTGDNIIFTGLAPTNYTTDNQGLSLVVENVSSSDYVLENDSKEEGRLYKYFSAYNVDTISPTFSIIEVDSDNISNLSQKHLFYITSSEDMMNSIANYKLLDEHNQPINITGYSGDGNDGIVQDVPVDTNIIEGAEVNLKLSNHIEGKYTLIIEGKDSANNLGSTKIENIWLDNKAPTVNITPTYQPQAGDGSKRIDFDFEVNDVSNTGRVYYCFVETGHSVPEKGTETWKFIEKGSTTTPVLKVSEGENWIGDLYYYATDICGNDSYVENNRYYALKYISLYNKSAQGYIVIDDKTPGLSSYDISFNDNNGEDKLEYRWIDKNSLGSGFVQESYRLYETSNEGTYPDIGGAIQTGDDGEEYLLDGTYELQCKIINNSSGNFETYSYTFIFDNSNPYIELPIWTNGTKIKETQQAIIRITDKGSIQSASYEIVDMNNNPIGVESVSLPIENDGDVNATVNISVPDSIGTGIYGIKIHAEDANGNLMTVGHNYLDGTDGKFNEKDTSYYNNTAMRFAVRTDKPTLELESVTGTTIENLYDNYYITGQSNYTINLIAQEVMKNIGDFNYSTYLKYQLSSDGVNWSGWKSVGSMSNDAYTDTSYLAFAINTPYNLNTGTDNNIFIRVACYNDPAELDITPDSKFISDPVVTSIKLDKSLAEYDIRYNTTYRTNQDVTAILTINDNSSKTYTVTSENPNITVTEATYGTVLTISKNVNTVIDIEDNLGNITEAPVEVNWIDKDFPDAILNSKESIDAGARKDAEINVTIKETLPNTTKFALMEHNGVPTEEDFNLFSRLWKEDKIKIDIISSEKSFGEYDETYTITIRGIDGEYYLGYKSEDALGNTISTSILGSNMIFKDSDIDFEGVSYNPTVTKSYTVATLKFNVPVAILPIDMMTVDPQQNLALAIEYGRRPDAKYTLEHEFAYEKITNRTYYICDQVGRAKEIQFSIEGVQFIEGFKNKVEYMINGEPIVINDGKWIGIKEDGELQVIVSPYSEYAAQYFYVLSDDYISGTSDMVINQSLSTIADSVPDEVYNSVYGEVYGDIYNTVVFDVLVNDSNLKEVQFCSYTLEGIIEDREQIENIAIENIDETAPVVIWELSNTEPSNKSVNAYISFNDIESGIAKVEEKDSMENYVVINESEYLESNQVIRVINDKDDFKAIKVTNKAGLVTTINDISAPNIDKSPIIESEHYTVRYSYENYAGEWLPIKEGNYYRAVKATIVSVDGIEKKLYIDNNNNSFEKILTHNVQSFVFDIMDTAGNGTSKSVSYDKYDIDVPSIEYSITPSTKTNKPVSLSISAKDSINTIAHCELYFIEDRVNSSIKVDKVSEGVYTSKLPNSGQYVIYVWDEAGNKATKFFEVNNIDYSPVEIATLTYSIPPSMITRQTVLVTIDSFNKSNVTMLSVEPVEGTALKQNDIVYSMGSRSIRFKKNGSVEVSFIDDYGNIGTDIITVENIRTTPPQCKGVFTLADNLTNATITFESLKSSSGETLERDLSKIYVVSGLINSAAVMTADEAEITVNENGTYNFILSDEVGNSQNVSVTVTGIDKEPPKVTAVKWDYDYLKEDEVTGDWNTINESDIDSSPSEEGYTLSKETMPETNQDVEVTVVTDKDINQIGSFDDTPSKETTFVYHDNGVFSFNLEALNETSVLYEVDVELIDKNKPVIQFNNTNELIFIEGDEREESKYDISKLYDFIAYDMRNNEPVEISKEKVKIDFGEFNPNDINTNEFNRNSPYYIIYKVADSAGNITEVTRTIRLIAFDDTIALINGIMPNSSNMVAVNDDEFTISLKNHSGRTYVKYIKGLYTMGEMKYIGEGVQANPNDTFTINIEESGWYTVSVQTDRKDFFNIHVYMNIEKVEE